VKLLTAISLSRHLDCIQGPTSYWLAVRSGQCARQCPFWIAEVSCLGGKSSPALIYTVNGERGIGAALVNSGKWRRLIPVVA
jgi:hypothetical protein